MPASNRHNGEQTAAWNTNLPRNAKGTLLTCNNLSEKCNHVWNICCVIVNSLWLSHGTRIVLLTLCIKALITQYLFQTLTRSLECLICKSTNWKPQPHILSSKTVPRM
jgi:hypothetical protein